MLPPQLPSPGQPGGPPNLRPSYVVHVTTIQPRQVGTASTGGPTWMTSSGFRLQDLLSTLYGIPAERIEFDQPELADLRSDVALRLPAKESESKMHRRIVRALEKHLGIAIRSVGREEDVYTVTVADPTRLPSQKAYFGGGFSSTVTMIARQTPDTNSLDQHALQQLMQARFEENRRQSGVGLDSIDMDGSVDELCRILETGVQRPVIDRTGYQGHLEISIQRNTLDRKQFFDKIKADYGLAIMPARAEVEHLIVTAETSKHSHR